MSTNNGEHIIAIQANKGTRYANIYWDQYEAQYEVRMRATGIEVEDEVFCVSDYDDNRAQARRAAEEYARDWVNEKPTNIEVITGLMSLSQHGPLMQVFIIDALMKQTERVIRAPKEKLENPIVDAQAWKDTAIELHNALMTHLGK